MDPKSFDEKERRDKSFTGFFAVVAFATACGIVLVNMPRAVEPARLPPLVLPRALVRDMLAKDRAEAGRAQAGAELDELYELYLGEGHAELAGQQGLLTTGARRQRMAILAPRLFEKLGAEGVRALRARAVERFMLARVSELEDKREAEGLVGTFPNILERYGLTRPDGSLRAPEVSVRALYKARWNMIHELPTRAFFDNAEKRAYEGFVALHAAQVPATERAASARVYYDLHGKRSGEALAVWLYQGRRLREAHLLLEKAAADEGALRARNMLLAVRFAEMMR